MSQVIYSFNKCVLSNSHVQGSHEHPKYKTPLETISSFKELPSLGEARRKQPHHWVYETMWEVPWQRAEGVFCQNEP